MRDKFAERALHRNHKIAARVFFQSVKGQKGDIGVIIAPDGNEDVDARIKAAEEKRLAKAQKRIAVKAKGDQ